MTKFENSNLWRLEELQIPEMTAKVQPEEKPKRNLKFREKDKNRYIFNFEVFLTAERQSCILLEVEM